MRNFRILDCTLRDGGYVNECDFGQDNIHKIIHQLTAARIDIIEYGFLSTSKPYAPDATVFDTVERASGFIPQGSGNSLAVVLADYGKFDPDMLPERQPGMVDGIRVTFHKNNIKPALEACKKVRSKGYLLFLQPMVSLSYTDEEFLQLIYESNKLKPYAFYIVDSFGNMKQRDLVRLFSIADNNLDSDICIGFHSHNNMQLSFSNAQMLYESYSAHDLIVDSSVFGMGRGAGNLNTELLVNYLSDMGDLRYHATPLLQIIDEVISPIYTNNYWGFSLPYYISALHHCHPNYATYLDNKNTLTVEDMNQILSTLDCDKKVDYDSAYIEQVYFDYQGRKNNGSLMDLKVKEIFGGKTVVLIAPGSSIRTQCSKVEQALANQEYISVSVNFIPNGLKTDYVFISNRRRYHDIQKSDFHNLIVTSNLKNEAGNALLCVDYNRLKNDIAGVMDNAGMMMIQLLILAGAKKVLLAGLDGYSHDIDDNFVDRSMSFIKKHIVMDSMNTGMEQALKLFSQDIQVEFITDPKYVHIH